jgi:hypothetical protein
MYGASEGLATISLEAVATGGQAGTSSKIENYLGFPTGISGGELAERAVLQAEKFGASFTVPAEATALDTREDGHVIRFADGSELSARTVLADTGYEGAGHGVHTPYKQPADGNSLAVDNRAYNTLPRSLRCQGERGFAILTGRWRALRALQHDDPGDAAAQLQQALQHRLTDPFFGDERDVDVIGQIVEGVAVGAAPAADRRIADDAALGALHEHTAVAEVSDPSAVGDVPVRGEGRLLAEQGRERRPVVVAEFQRRSQPIGGGRPDPGQRELGQSRVAQRDTQVDLGTAGPPGAVRTQRRAGTRRVEQPYVLAVLVVYGACDQRFDDDIRSQETQFFRDCHNVIPHSLGTAPGFSSAGAQIVWCEWFSGRSVIGAEGRRAPAARPCGTA